MANKRDTVTYELREATKIVYFGTTDDPKRREQEHREAGKNFSKLKVTSRKMTEDGAKKKEAARLAIYRKNQGKNPKYNEDSDG